MDGQKNMRRGTHILHAHVCTSKIIDMSWLSEDTKYSNTESANFLTVLSVLPIFRLHTFSHSLPIFTPRFLSLSFSYLNNDCKLSFISRTWKLCACVCTGNQCVAVNREQM